MRTKEKIIYKEEEESATESEIDTDSNSEDRKPENRPERSFLIFQDLFWPLNQIFRLYDQDF